MLWRSGMSLIEKIQSTKTDEIRISNSIKQVSYDEHTLLVITHPTCQAAVSLQGAHLLYWLPTGEKSPVLWLSDKALFKKQTPIRGGIPICWPWFGKSADPMHGFARLVDWQLSSHTENENGVDLVLSLKNNEQTEKYWQHAFTLELHLHLGQTCTAELSSLGSFEATSALHTYFGVSDINKVVVSGLGADYIERLAQENKPSVVGEMTFNQEVDRIYTESDKTVLIKDVNRTIKLTHIAHSDVVIWNPWVDKAKATNDLADDSYNDFLCAETCRINKPLKLDPQQKTSYGLKIEVIK